MVCCAGAFFSGGQIGMPTIGMGAPKEGADGKQGGAWTQVK